MTIAPLALAQIGTVVSTVGAVAGVIGNMRAASYQSQVAARNAAIAEENARRELERSQVEQVDYADDARQQIGALEAAMAASGFDSFSGSSAASLLGRKTLARRDAERIRTSGVETANRFRQQSSDFQIESKQARRAGFMSLLSGAADIGSTYISGSQQVARIKGLIE